MNSSPYTMNRPFVALAILFVMALCGCASVLEQTVPVDKQIMLNRQEGGKGSFNRGELTVQYDYSTAGTGMTMAGTVWHRRSVDSLDVRVVFVDGTGKVVGTKLVYSTGFRTEAARKGSGNFRESLTIPPRAVGFSFSYSSQERTSRK